MFPIVALVFLAFQAVTGSQLIRAGRLQEALAGYLQAVQADPKSADANSGAGVVLDLLARYSEALPYFNQAIKASATRESKAKAQRMLAIHYGFAHDCRGAERADRAVYEYYLEAPDFYSAGEVADELGRLCLDAGDFDIAYDWYRRGHDAGWRETNIPAERKDLWDFRWAHARARIAARRGKLEEARKYVAAAKAILDKGRMADQQPFFPYLTGYVDFYAGDYSAALAELQKADTADPFIQCLIAQSYEKLGGRAHALEYYRMAAATTMHSVSAAYARPFASAHLE